VGDHEDRSEEDVAAEKERESLGDRWHHEMTTQPNGEAFWSQSQRSGYGGPPTTTQL
jgi:hypothetical protein